jgi:hypothetical protein
MPARAGACQWRTDAGCRHPGGAPSWETPRAARQKDSVDSEPFPDRSVSPLRFEKEDLFVDAAASQARVRWTSGLAHDGHTCRVRGLHILQLGAGRVSHKLTEAGSERPLVFLGDPAR